MAMGKTRYLCDFPSSRISSNNSVDARLICSPLVNPSSMKQTEQNKTQPLPFDFEVLVFLIVSILRPDIIACIRQRNLPGNAILIHVTKMFVL